MALAGAFLWGRAALLPSCFFVSRAVDYTNYGSMGAFYIACNRELATVMSPPPGLGAMSEWRFLDTMELIKGR
jgi:hypothetical protein